MGIGNRVNGMEWDEKEREKNQCLYAVTRCFKICIRRYPDSAEQAVLWMSLPFVAAFLLRFVFTFTRRLDVKSLRKEMSSHSPNRIDSLWKSCLALVNRATNFVHFKFSACLLDRLIISMIYKDNNECLTCACAISIWWVMRGHFCSILLYLLNALSEIFGCNKQHCFGRHLK